MKTLPSLLSVTLVLCSAPSVLAASSIGSQSQPVPAPTPYAITVQDANSRVWERTTYELDPSGQAVPKKHSYSEVASGLNHLVNGQWVESKEWIDILPNGTAVATNGQHQAYFPGDIYDGQIELVTPDGQHLQSRPLGLFYFDGDQTVMIGELTNSIGVVVGNNQVVYPNAFTDLKVDLRYTYTKAGFEQDIILRQQPPTPESLGLNPATARLQVMTEFFSAPQPTVRSQRLAPQAGLSLTDQTLGFGAMQMVPGRAFLMGSQAEAAKARVNKQWVKVSGRQILIEEVPVDSILEGLAALPLTAMNSSSSKNAHTASKHLTLPPQRLARNDTAKTMLLAKADMPTQGFVLDYQTVSSSLTNYTFQGDTTYYLSGTLNLYGTNVIEGGTVLKYATSISLNINGSLNCQTGPYRPAIFTAMDDNSVGETIASSTGNPSGYYAATALSFNNPTTPIYLHDFRISYASTAVNVSGSSASLAHTLRHGQIYKANYMVLGAYNNSSTLAVQNVLAYNIGSAVFYSLSSASGTAFSAQYCTMNHVSQLFYGAYSTIYYKQVNDSLLVFVTNSTTAYQGANNGTNNSDATFQAAGGGAFYLATSSPFRNAGTTNIDSVLLAALRQKTTYPPIIYTNATISVATTYSLQAQRDTDTPDLGYHYDPIDYAFGGCTANSNLTFTAGTVAGWFRTSSGWDHAGYSIHMADQTVAAFTGTAAAPTYWVRLNTVQEQDRTSGYGPGGIEGWTTGGAAYAPLVAGWFLRCAAMAGEGVNYFRDDYGALKVQLTHSEFWGGSEGGYGTQFHYTNCLFDRASMWIDNSDTSPMMMMRDCTMRGGLLTQSHRGGVNWYSSIRDTAFDGTAFTIDENSGGNPAYVDYNYNAFLQGFSQLPSQGTNNITVTNSFNWQNSWLGNYYQLTNSLLINKGDVTANLAGLYHFTTQTNQVKEANSTVDIGYHYVATDAYGNPIDTNGDGLPDYLEDANGNGVFDAGDLGEWKVSPFGLGGASTLQVFTPLK